MCSLLGVYTIPPNGNNGRVSVRGPSSSSSSDVFMAESKTDGEGEELETDGSHDTESIPRDSGLLSSSSVMCSAKDCILLLFSRDDDEDRVTVDDVDGCPTNADTIADDVKQLRMNDIIIAKGVAVFMI